jgi:hypothetical protein
MSDVNPMVVDQLRTDPGFAVDFIVDNNPEGVLAHLTSLNLLPVAPQEATKGTVKSTLRTISDEETLREVLSVPYDNEQSNYTGGYAQTLNVAPDAKAGPAGVAIVNGILNLGTSVAGAFTAQANAESSAASNQAALEMQQAQIAADAQTTEANKVLGLPLNAFLAIIGGVVAVIVIALLTTRR